VDVADDVDRGEHEDHIALLISLFHQAEKDAVLGPLRDETPDIAGDSLADDLMRVKTWG
jgi:hypothetical protein